MHLPLIGRWVAATALALTAILLPPSSPVVTLAAPTALAQPTASFEVVRRRSAALGPM